MDLKREIRITDPSPQLRLVAVVGLLAAVAGLLFVFTRSHSSSQTRSPAAPTVSSSALVAPARPGVAPTPVPQRPALPAAVQNGLAQNRIVVVALYAPGVPLDQLALLEARAGAAKVGAAFAAVDVTRPAVDELSSRYSVLHDPSVLVLRPPAGELVVKLDGFADENTVAQAAAPAGQQ